MEINFEPKTNKFIIRCGPSDNGVVSGMPDRRFRKGSRTWSAPALRQNIEYMRKHMNNVGMYTKEALEAYNQKINMPCETKKKMPSWYEFKNAPREFQAETMDKAYGLDEYAILFEQGLGKTFTAINLAAAWRMNGDIEAVVVICPSSIKLVWEEELEVHCPIPTQTHAMMAGKYKKVDKFMETKTDFQWFVAGIESLSQGYGYEYIERFLLSRKCLIILDESSGIKTPGKTRTDRCISFGLMAAKRLILSGTSITQGIEDLYTQFRFLNPQIIGYDSYYTFRSQYCIVTSIEVAENKYVQKIIGYKNEDELIRSLSPYTSRVEKADATDLPEKTFQNRYVTMNPKQKKAYDDMKYEMFTEIGNVEYEVDTILEQLLRLQQISGGFYPKDDGKKVVTVPIPGKNPKLEELMKVMAEIPGKVVIWCRFRPEIALVAEALRKKGIQTVEFHGGCNDIEKKFAVHSFRKDADTRVFLATRAASRGLTLVEASTSIYYSTGHSLEDYAQSQDRIHRIGQTDPCTYIHLLADKTIDAEVLDVLAGKKVLADMVYSMLKDK